MIKLLLIFVIDTLEKQDISDISLIKKLLFAYAIFPFPWLLQSFGASYLYFPLALLNMSLDLFDPILSNILIPSFKLKDINLAFNFNIKWKAFNLLPQTDNYAMFKIIKVKDAHKNPLCLLLSIAFHFSILKFNIFNIIIAKWRRI